MNDIIHQRNVLLNIFSFINVKNTLKVICINLKVYCITLKVSKNLSHIKSKIFLVLELIL